MNTNGNTWHARITHSGMRDTNRAVVLADLINSRYAYHQGTGQAITLPRTSNEQFNATKDQAVAEADLQPGDLMFWGEGRIHHVALYIGNGRMIEAPESGKRVTETAIRTKGDYAGATPLIELHTLQIMCRA